MLLVTPESRRWRLRALVLLVALAALYGWAAAGGFAHGGSAFGLTLGFAAFGLILLLTAYGVRKRRYKSTLGRLEGWLQSHVWLGLVSVFVVLFHAGFRFADRVAVAALVALVLVVATGLAGALLYTTVPRRLTGIASDLTPEAASERLNQLAASMARLAAGRSATFQRLAGAVLAEARPGAFAGWRIVFRPGAARAARAAGGEGPAWEALLARVDRAEQEDLRRLLVLSRQHKELHLRLVAQRRYQNLLDAWLWLHLPLTAALLALAVAHGVAALYYRGLG
jgi:hypothetical protein